MAVIDLDAGVLLLVFVQLFVLRGFINWKKRKRYRLKNIAKKSPIHQFTRQIPAVDRGQSGQCWEPGT